MRKDNKIIVVVLITIAIIVILSIKFTSPYDDTDEQISDCESIDGRWGKGACLAIQNRDPSKCESLKTVRVKDLCFRVIALSENNSEYCFKMIDNDDTGSCLGAIAAIKNEISICEDVDEVYVREICYSWMAEEQKNYTLCEHIETQSTRDWCYGLGWDEAKPKICEKIIDQEKRDSCYYSSGANGAGCKVCERIITKHWKDLCEKNLCDYTVKTIAECDAISDEGEKYSCYISFAVENENASICSQISDTLQKDMCFISVTREINRYRYDDSLCEYVSDIRKDWCYEAVE